MSLELKVIQLHTGRPAEEADADAHLPLVRNDLFHRAAEVQHLACHLRGVSAVVTQHDRVVAGQRLGVCKVMRLGSSGVET